MTRYLYRVAYRRDLTSRVYHRTVVAADPDEARRLVAISDPKYLATVRTPRRQAVVEVPA